ncbi:hypothetical protein V2J09_013820 [Rumex salicifolius]
MCPGILNKDVFSCIQTRKENLLSEIQGFQTLIASSASDQLLQQEENLVKELDIVLEQEEVFSLQKSREKWITLGDINTSFFNMSTIIYRRQNRIDMLKIEENVWDSEARELEKMVVDYFRNPYMIDENSLTRRPLSLSRMELEYLEKPFTREEIENAIRSLRRFKAPCPDGFQPIFYQQCWDVVGKSVIRFVLDFFETRILPWSMNDALLVLIAKVSKPERISQFMPISLCNVLFKTITKAMVNHLKSVIAKLIGPIQEVVHSMQRKQGKRGWMLLKLDLDHIRWDFLEDTLVRQRVGSAIGTPILTDYNFANQEKLSYARVLVEISSKDEPLTEVIFRGTDGELIHQELIYQWLPPRCPMCLVFGPCCSSAGLSIHQTTPPVGVASNPKTRLPPLNLEPLLPTPPQSQLFTNPSTIVLPEAICSTNLTLTNLLLQSLKRGLYSLTPLREPPLPLLPLLPWHSSLPPPPPNSLSPPS